MADLDTLIRFMARKQIKRLTTAARQRHGRLIGMAARAKDKDTKARYKHLATSMLEHANAAARRLQITAENTADAYQRAMAKVTEEAQAMKPAKKAVAKKPAAKKAAKTKN
jgi:hypothetical protein